MTKPKEKALKEKALKEKSIMKEKSTIEENNLHYNLPLYLEENKKLISGLQFTDGSILLGELDDIIVDKDLGIWVRFRGRSPVAGANSTLTQFLTEGLEDPEALVTESIYPLAEIHHFILGVASVKMLKKIYSKDSEPTQIDFSKAQEINTQIKQEKIKKDTKIN